jgi:hypothetical protein
MIQHIKRKIDDVLVWLVIGIICVIITGKWNSKGNHDNS